MIAKRIVTVLTLDRGVLFRTKLFRPDYRYTLNFVDAWSVDEVIILDITRGQRGNTQAFFEVIDKFARRCFVPLAVGGGINSVDDVKRFLDRGADKVVVNTEAFRHPELIKEIAETYGSQCVVLSIDAKMESDGTYQVYTDCGATPVGLSPVEWAKRAEAAGAGEIMITSMDKDGSLEGYDLELARTVSNAVSIPVLALGGCGKWSHMFDLFNQTTVSAACTQNIYHFTESSICSAKSYLHQQGIDVRQ